MNPAAQLNHPPMPGTPHRATTFTNTPFANTPSGKTTSGKNPGAKPIRIPAEVDDLVAAIGQGQTICLIEQAGGTWLEIPRHPTPRGRLARLLGLEVAHQLAQATGPRRRYLPLLRRWRWQILEAAGIPVPQIATRLGVSVKTIHRWRQAQPLHRSPPSPD